MKLLNAFSLNMIDLPSALYVEEITLKEAQDLVAKNEIESAVGHEYTAFFLAQQLGVHVPVNRINIMLRKNESALVGQYEGPRLPEGATELPQGARIKWILVTVN